MQNQKIILNLKEIQDILDKFCQFSTPVFLRDEHEYYLKAKIYLLNPYTNEVILRPYDLQTPFLLHKGQSVLVHNDRNNIFFKSEIAEGSREYFIKIKVPYKIELIEKREFFREEFRSNKFKVFFNNFRTLNLSKESILHQGTLLNLNEKGIFIQSKDRAIQNFKCGDKIIFTSIQDYPIKKKITGVIRSLSAHGSKNFFIGIEFSEKIEVNKLIDYLEDLGGISSPKIRDLILEELTSGHGKLASSTSIDRTSESPE